MSELLSEAFRLVNLPFTLLLILVVLYWLLVAVGALGGEHGDGGTDLHGGHDLGHDLGGDGLHHDVGGVGGHDGHADAGGHDGVDGHGGGSLWNDALRFINLGDIPVMVVLSVLILSGWAFSVLSNYYLTGGAPLLVLACLAGNLVASVVVTRYVTMPLRPLFRMLNKQYDPPVKIVGGHCRIVTSEATPDFGQAEVATNGVPLLIHVRTLNDAVLRRGDLAVVVREDGDRRIFFVTANPIPTH